MTNNSEKNFWGNEATPEKSPQKKSKRNWLIGLGLLFVFALFTFAGFQTANHFLRDMGMAGETAGESATEKEAPPGKETKRLSVLLLGIDQRENEPARSDTILLAFLDMGQNQLKLLSIPRDTYAAIPGRRNNEKLAHAHAYGGAELTVATVENLLNMKIDRYVTLNFEGFKNMIDALGGVEMEVERRMYHPEEDIDLQPGLQRLNGYDSLAYVRYRKYDPRGDIGRIERQQKFLKELAEETLRLGTIFKLPELIKEANKSIATNISTTEMLSLIKAAKNFDTANIEAATLPGTDQRIDKLDYWVPSTTDVQELLRQFTAPQQTAKNEPEMMDKVAN